MESRHLPNQVGKYQTDLVDVDDARHCNRAVLLGLVGLYTSAFRSRACWPSVHQFNGRLGLVDYDLRCFLLSSHSKCAAQCLGCGAPRACDFNGLVDPNEPSGNSCVDTHGILHVSIWPLGLGSSGRTAREAHDATLAIAVKNYF